MKADETDQEAEDFFDKLVSNRFDEMKNNDDDDDDDDVHNNEIDDRIEGMMKESFSSGDEEYEFGMYAENVLHPLDITGKVEPDEIILLKIEFNKLKLTNPQYFSQIMASIDQKEG
jgi:hypothetical protein